MKNKKNNINILVIFIILAIIGLLIYVILYNRNKKSNPTTTSDILTYPSPYIIIVPKDPNSISIGFSPVVDKNTGNISISESYNALGLYKMSYIFGGKNILNTMNIPVECFKGITIDEFSSNTGVIAITNVILPQNPQPGNIPYPGKDLTMYVLNKKTGQMNSYNLSRSVTFKNNYGNVNINNISNNTRLLTSINDCTDTINGPVFITFYIGL